MSCREDSGPSAQATAQGAPDTEQSGDLPGRGRPAGRRSSEGEWTAGSYLEARQDGAGLPGAIWLSGRGTGSGGAAAGARAEGRAGAGPPGLSERQTRHPPPGPARTLCPSECVRGREGCGSERAPKGLRSGIAGGPRPPLPHRGLPSPPGLPASGSRAPAPPRRPASPPRAQSPSQHPTPVPVGPAAPRLPPPRAEEERGPPPRGRLPPAAWPGSRRLQPGWCLSLRPHVARRPRPVALVREALNAGSPVSSLSWSLPPPLAGKSRRLRTCPRLLDAG